MQLPTDVALSQSEVQSEGDDGVTPFSLKDFLSFAGGAYSTYANLSQSSDTAKVAQANAAQQAAVLQQQQQQNSQLKTYLLYGGAAIVGVVLLLVVVKFLRK